MTAAKVVGSSRHVIATDISAQMLAIAKERAMSIYDIYNDSISNSYVMCNAQ